MNRLFQSDLNVFLTDQNRGELKLMQPVSGGSINDAFKLETTSGNYFLKANNAKRYPKMFETEALGLNLLSRSEFIVPKVIGTAVSGDHQFMLMSWVEKGNPKEGFWNEFGRSLARLHTITDLYFGLNHDNYIGSLTQSNYRHDTWADFYRQERLVPQMKLAESQGRLTSFMKRGFDALFSELENIFPKEKPSLLHGDLWRGNMMITSTGSPSIFDPAVYYGHREMDLAMMALFGGFGNRWVDAYCEVYPLEQGWENRIPIGQLYPLMVHVNLFGGGYGSDVESILRKFV